MRIITLNVNGLLSAAEPDPTRASAGETTQASGAAQADLQTSTLASARMRSSAAGTAFAWMLVSGKLTNAQRTLPVAMYSRSSTGNVSSAKRRQ